MLAPTEPKEHHDLVIW